VEPTSPAAFYCVSSGEYFLGAVAMVNSLRLLGHSEPIFILDCGMSPTQRELVSDEVTVVPAPDDSQPFLLKTILPLRHPAEVMVLIDADMIVTRSLADLIERASQGRAVAVEDRLDRFVPEWGELLGLGTAHRRPYISSSLMFLGGNFGSRVITDVGEAFGRIDMRGTAYFGPERGFQGTFDIASMEHPWCFADQDVFNAVLSVEAAPGQLQTLDARLTAAPPFTGVSVLNQQTLRCAYDDGTEPYVLHHVFPVKPWLDPTIPGVYSQLLTRLLHGEDVAVRVPNRELPPHMQSGLLAAARNLRRGGLSARARAFRDRLRREPAP
jgi:hypothetical protein